LHSTKWSNGKKKNKKKGERIQEEEEEEMETILLKKKKNSIRDSEGNEENGYPVPDPNKTMINVTRWLQKQPEKRNLVRN
jgi:hypothetical protein